MQSFIKKNIRSVLNLFIEKQLSPLASDTSQTIQKLGTALIQGIRNDTDYEENRTFERIAELRKDLASDKTYVTIIDYGAYSAKETQLKHSALTGLSVSGNSHGTARSYQIGKLSKRAAKDFLWYLILYKIIKQFHFSSVLELGTCLGVSAMYLAAAARNTGGNVTTLEGAKPFLAVAKKNFKKIGYNSIHTVLGRFQDTLPGVLKNHPPFDFVFVDGHHDGEAAIKYFHQIKKHLTSTAVIVFDDIHWSKSMLRGWNEIRSDSSITISIDLREIGICLFTPEQRPALRFDAFYI